MGLRMNGEVANFRVVARGLGCIPVLKVWKKVSSRQLAARCAVYQEMSEGEPEVIAASGKNAPPPPRARGLTERESYKQLEARRRQ
jgi:hypothetical protein